MIELRQWMASIDMAFISDWPITAWVILLAAGVFAGEYLLLLVRWRRFRPSADLAERRLSSMASALKDYANAHGRLLPATTQELGVPESAGVVFRQVPKLDFDEKLILIHDCEPTHKIIEFPVLRDGRGLVFCNGRMHIVTEEVFDKLMFADDALRERLGLEPFISAPERTLDAGRD